MCNCVEQIDQAWSKANKDQIIETVSVFSFSSDQTGYGIPIPILKRSTGSRITARSVWANFCPFCGKPWNAFEEQPISQTPTCTTKLIELVKLSALTHHSFSSADLFRTYERGDFLAFSNEINHFIQLVTDDISDLKGKDLPDTVSPEFFAREAVLSVLSLVLDKAKEVLQAFAELKDVLDPTSYRILDSSQPFANQCVEQAEKLGHKLSVFDSDGPSQYKANCLKCNNEVKVSYYTEFTYQAQGYALFLECPSKNKE